MSCDLCPTAREPAPGLPGTGRAGPRCETNPGGGGQCNRTSCGRDLGIHTAPAHARRLARAWQREHRRALLRPAAACGGAVERQPAVATFVVGEPAEHPGLDRTAPAALAHRGAVASAEADLAHTCSCWRGTARAPVRPCSGVAARATSNTVGRCRIAAGRGPRRLPLTNAMWPSVRAPIRRRDDGGAADPIVGLTCGPQSNAVVPQSAPRALRGRTVLAGDSVVDGPATEREHAAPLRLKRSRRSGDRSAPNRSHLARAPTWLLDDECGSGEGVARSPVGAAARTREQHRSSILANGSGSVGRDFAVLLAGFP